MTQKRHPTEATHNISIPHTCNTSCNTATEPKCTCGCEGSGHQRTLVEMAIEYPCKSPDINLGEGQENISFPMFLQRRFGPQSADLLSSPPKTAQTPQWAKGWPGKDTASKSSLREQRILDTTMHDIFLYIGNYLADGQPKRDPWLKALDQLMPAHPFRDELRHSDEEPDKYSSYLWGSFMAAFTDLDPQTIRQATEYPVSPAAANARNLIEKTIRHDLRSPEYRDIRYPRGRSGNNVHTIGYLLPSNAANTIQVLSDYAIKVINKKCIEEIMAQPNGPGKLRMLACFVGCASSPNLWHHPIVVRRCLMPLAETLKASLSLKHPQDAPSLIRENLIEVWDSNPRKDII